MKRHVVLSPLLTMTLILSTSAQTPQLSQPKLPAKFQFITPETTLQEVVDRLGQWQKVRGSGMLYYEYDLPDGSAVLVHPAWPFKVDNKVEGCTFYPKASDISLAP